MQLKQRILNIIIYIFALGINLNAQYNYVPNPSFEEKDSCPTFEWQLTPVCKYWFDPIAKMTIPPPPIYSFNNWGIAEYFHSCGGAYVDVPKNLAGWQYARTGEAYAGTSVLVHDTQTMLSIPYPKMAQSYIEVELKQSLQKDTYYKASFFYSHAEVYSNSPTFFMEYLGFVRLGMLFTDTLVYNLPNATSYGQPHNIYGSPQISAMMGPTVDTALWVEVSGTFKAKGGEKFITIGCFERMDTAQKQIFTYVFYDDISVVYVGEDTIETPDSLWIPNIFTPNQDGINDQFEYKNQEQWNFETQIFNRWGNLVYEDNNSKNWDGTYKGNGVSAGVYFYIIKAQAIKNGEVKVYKGTVTVVY